MDASPWALTVAYWLHMLATVVWIGGLTALSLFVLPAAQRHLEPEQQVVLLDGLQKRLNPWSWFCLALLAGTGMFQMSASPFYEGFLAIENRWAVAILIKHLLFLGMTLLSAYMTWGLLPALQRILLRRVALGAEQPGEQAAAMSKLLHQQQLILRLNLILGVLVLGLTALARAA